MHRHLVHLAVAGVAVVAATLLPAGSSFAAPGPTTASTTGSACDAHCQAIQRIGRALVARDGGPPGLIVLVDSSGKVADYSFGSSKVGTATPIMSTDHLRLASVSKAYSGAVALALVARGVLHLSDKVGTRVRGLPSSWRNATLTELLQHTSGIPDFIRSPEFAEDITAHPDTPPSRYGLVRLAFPLPMTFTPPGSSYHYSNTENELVGLMVQQATHRTYEQELADLVTGPLGLADTSLPDGVDLPTPYAHGYTVQPGTAPVDETNAFAAGWSWAAGGVVATPTDVDRFIRAYARGALTTPAVHADQFRFRPGSSEPPGPGTNAAGLAIFRYRTSCGTVYGHTGNTLGYTQFAASTSGGTRSVVVQVNGQITPAGTPGAFAQLLAVEDAAVCAALGG